MNNDKWTNKARWFIKLDVQCKKHGNHIKALMRRKDNLIQNPKILLNQ